LHYLTRAYAENSLSHALLFTGLQGVGKQAAAQLFSMICNCVEKTGSGLYNPVPDERSGDADDTLWPCGLCRSCQKILNNSHPDILLVRPTGAIIKIDQIRGLIQRLSLKPYEAVNRFVIIAEADSMTAEAGNALLKVLEEPPDRTTIILTAGQVSDLLPTIVSRCMHFRLSPLPEDYIARILQEEHNASAGEAKVIANMAFGNMTKAVSMKKGDWLDRRNRLVKELVDLRDKSIGFALAFAERVTQDKEFLAECLDIFITWLRDLVVFPFAPHQIIYADLEDTIRDECRKSDIEILLALIDLVQTTRKKIESNANTRLCMETLAMKLSGR